MQDQEVNASARRLEKLGDGFQRSVGRNSVTRKLLLQEIGLVPVKDASFGGASAAHAIEALTRGLPTRLLQTSSPRPRPYDRFNKPVSVGVAAGLV